MNLTRCSGAFLFAYVAIALAAFMPTVAEASRVSPMIVEMEPTGRRSVARIELTSESPRDIAYEVQMMRGDISPEGELSLEPADEEFVVFPPQVVVEARSQQVFRVQYVGEEALSQSQVYYLAIRQVPVEFDPGVNQVQVVVNFNVLINVVPEDAAPVAAVREASYIEREVPSETPSAEGEEAAPPATEKGILVSLANDGNRYFFAGRSSWKITGETVDGEPFSLTLDDHQGSRVFGTGVVAPGKNRIFFIPTEEAVRSETLKVDVNP